MHICVTMVTKWLTQTYTYCVFIVYTKRLSLPSQPEDGLNSSRTSEFTLGSGPRASFSDALGRFLLSLALSLVSGPGLTANYKPPQKKNFFFSPHFFFWPSQLRPNQSADCKPSHLDGNAVGWVCSTVCMCVYYSQWCVPPALLNHLKVDLALKAAGVLFDVFWILFFFFFCPLGLMLTQKVRETVKKAEKCIKKFSYLQTQWIFLKSARCPSQ